MLLNPEETVRTATIDAFVKAIRAERDPWRQARLLAFVRKQRQHSGLQKVAKKLSRKKATTWAAQEILAQTSPEPPRKGDVWIEPISGICFLRIRAGRFLMGMNPHPLAERPVHPVIISREYWMARHPVVNREFSRYLEQTGKQPTPLLIRDPRYSVPDQPVVNVCWDEAENGFCAWLRDRTGLPFHLPTEAEWEFACRAGSRAKYSFGDGAGPLNEYAWFGNCCEFGHPHLVGMKRSNRWGLSDIHGNVWEWCWNFYYRYPLHPERDPTGPRTGLERVYRGGSWQDTASDCRVGQYGLAGSGLRVRTLGFRVALSWIPREIRD